MSDSKLQFSSQLLQVYCHGIQLSCSELIEILKTSEVKIKRVMHNTFFDLLELHRVDKSVTSRLNTFHLLDFKHTTPAIIEETLVESLSDASCVGEALNTICEFMCAIDSPVQPEIKKYAAKTEVSLSLGAPTNNLDAESLQFIVVMRLMKIIRLMNMVAKKPVSIHALKIVGTVQDASTPYLKLNRPEFIYHRQKHNQIVFDNRSLKTKCSADNSRLTNSIWQYKDIFQSFAKDQSLNQEQNLVSKLQNFQRIQSKSGSIVTKEKGFTLDQRTTTRHKMVVNSTENVGIREANDMEEAIKILNSINLPATEIERRIMTSVQTDLSGSLRTSNKLRPGEFHNGIMIRLN